MKTLALGDTVTMIWDPAVVKPFTNADFSLSLPPAGLQDDFTFQAKGVIDFIKDSTDYSELKADQGLQRSLLGSLQDIRKWEIIFGNLIIVY